MFVSLDMRDVLFRLWGRQGNASHMVLGTFHVPYLRYILHLGLLHLGWSEGRHYYLYKKMCDSLPRKWLES